jgi:hypothetical protein
MKAILLVTVVIALGVISGCATVALAPGADKVRLSKDAADVATCKVVGNVKRPQEGNSLDAEPTIRNQAVGLGGNTVFITQSDMTGPVQGIAYQCP